MTVYQFMSNGLRFKDEEECNHISNVKAKRFCYEETFEKCISGRCEKNNKKKG